MGNPLRDRQRPSELAASRQVIEFVEKITEFERLAGIVKDDLETLDPDKLPSDWRNARVSGRLCFGFSDAQNNVPMLEGVVEASIDAVCQRCLDAFRLPLRVDLRLLLGDNESTKASGLGFEVWELEEDRLRPHDIVEEALIMAMPLAAMHVDDASCTGPEEPEPDAGEDRIRPFAALRAQMDNEN